MKRFSSKIPRAWVRRDADAFQALTPPLMGMLASSFDRSDPLRFEYVVVLLGAVEEAPLLHAAVRHLFFVGAYETFIDTFGLYVWNVLAANPYRLNLNAFIRHVPICWYNNTAVEDVLLRSKKQPWASGPIAAVANAVITELAALEEKGDRGQFPLQRYGILACVHALELWAEPAFRIHDGIDMLFVNMLPCLMTQERAGTVTFGTRDLRRMLCGTVLKVSSFFPEFISNNRDFLLHVWKCAAQPHLDVETRDAMRTLFQRHETSLMLLAYRTFSESDVLKVYGIFASVCGVKPLQATILRHEWLSSAPAEECPITLDACRYPVVASDGFTYEFADLVRHMTKSPYSPMTRRILDTDLFHRLTFEEI